MSLNKELKSRTDECSHSNKKVKIVQMSTQELIFATSIDSANTYLVFIVFMLDKLEYVKVNKVLDSSLISIVE